MVGVFRHGEMSQPFHDSRLGTLDAGGGTQGIFGRAGKIVFPGQQINRALAGVDIAHPVAIIAVGAIEIQITLEDTGATL